MGGVVVYLVNEMGVVQTKEVRSTTASSTPLAPTAATAPIPLPPPVDLEVADLTKPDDDVVADTSGYDAVDDGVLRSDGKSWTGEDERDRARPEGVPGSRGAEGVGEDEGDRNGPEGVLGSFGAEGAGEDDGDRVEPSEEGVKEAEVGAVAVEKGERKAKVRPFYPWRPGQPDCAFYVESGYCKFKADCKFHHPPNRRNSRKGQYIKQPDAVQVAEKQKNVAQQSVTQQEYEKDSRMDSSLKEGDKKIKYPQRPDCTFFTKTGTCKFGSACRFNHPPDRKKNKEKIERQSEQIQVKFALCDNRVGENSEITGNLKEGDERIKYPHRADATDCAFYTKTGTCKFGSACRFNHPPDRKKNKEKVENQTEHIQDVKEKSKEPSPRSFGRKEKHYTTPRVSKFEISEHSNHHGVKEAPSVALNFLNLPIRPGAKECPQYMSEGSCKFGIDCKHHHPDPTATNEPDPVSLYQDGQCTQQFGSGVSPSPGMPWHVPTSYITGMHLPSVFYPNPEWSEYQVPVHQSEMDTQDRSASHVSHVDNKANVLMHQQTHTEYPERPGQPECQYFKKTGVCKYRSACKFHHPKNHLRKNTNFSSEPKLN